MLHTLTYSHSLSIPLTRACGADCKYCTFKNDERKLLSFDEIEALVRQYYNSGICEVVIAGGQNLDAIPELPGQWQKQGYSSFIEYVRDICHLLLENHLIPTLELGPLSYAQLETISPYIAGITINLENVNPDFIRGFQTGKSLDDKIESLSDAGLLGIPASTRS